jgi:DNA-binding transcriptional MocR family regulator
MGRGRLRKFQPCSVTSDFSASARSSGITNLAIGDADDRNFQADEFAAGMLRSRNGSGPTTGPYGDGPLLTALANYYQSFGIQASPDRMVLTGGGIATNAALAMAIGAKGARVVLQDPAFPHAADYFESFNLQVIGVPTLKGDLDTQRFEDEAKTGRVKAAFLFLTVNQCTGETASVRNKREVLEIAERYGVAIFEDVSAFWTYDGVRLPNMRELADGTSIDVVAFDCMTKTLGRTVPVSCVFADGRLREQITIRSLGLGSSPPSLMQHALRVFVESRSLATHVSRAAPRHQARRNATIQALREKIPAGCSWTEPKVGHSVWLRFPTDVDESRLYEDALSASVAVAPGISAMVPRRPASAVRISYGGSSVDEIASAIARLAKVVEAQLS